MRAGCFGASVRGPLHSKENQPNQDAWLNGAKRAGHFAVVCDGMGSRPQARHGARAACRAVRRALGLWGQAKQADLDALPRLINVLWKLEISPFPPEECATTCLFALLTPDGDLLTGGLGDGLAALKTGKGITVLTERESEAFANQTLALGCPHRLEDWVLHRFSLAREPFELLLATDGIADDLQIERLDDFIAWLVSEFKTLPASQRWRSLRRELNHWPTPRHLDDKTLALLWQEEYDE
ncbi:MAG: protein phosphatase 2C domain-containing protein [Gammaproteobacteria bacterium]|nr:protein phosphatase 2C domain-containing protein [Gammaproteobacteria bacterium]